MSGVEDLAALQVPDALAAREQLDALLSLPPEVGIRGARITGHGSRATAEIDLANGETMVFDALRDMTRPANLAAEVVACTGVAISLKQSQAMKAVSLVRTLAERTQTTTDNDDAVDWGTSYLQAATVIDVDMESQRERWAAFSKLKQAQAGVEFAEAPGREGIFAASTIVLRATNGTRLVRIPWFQRYVARTDTAISRQVVTVRMLRVGWQIRGKTGRIKATCPSRPETLAWSFLLVPAGWEDR